ncbi:MAG TPA: gluconate 2-dehydrogenase subunit 3 family protein [Gemmatimonadales bacterium]
MDRRSLLGLLGATAAVAAAPGDLADVGRAIHRRLGGASARRVLGPHQDATVVALTDVILPATDTPGAKAARVNEFVDLLLAEWSEAQERDSFLAGLATVDTRAREMFGKDFVDGTPGDQTKLLTVLDNEAAQWNAKPRGRRGPEPFYRRMKWLTLFGYYTSQVGAEQEAHFAIIPGRFVPCAPADSTAGSE